MAAMSLSAFAAELSGPISWTTAMDLGGRYVGALSAAMNMTGHFGGSVAPSDKLSLWGRMESCGRLTIGPPNFVFIPSRPIDNRPQDSILPHNYHRYFSHNRI
jgi:hypothetical protein